MSFKHRIALSGRVASLALAGLALTATAYQSDLLAQSQPVGETGAAAVPAAAPEARASSFQIAQSAKATNASQVWARAFSLMNALDANLISARPPQLDLAPPVQVRLDNLSAKKTLFRAQPITCTTRTAEANRANTGVRPAGSRSAMVKSLAIVVFGLARGAR